MITAPRTGQRSRPEKDTPCVPYLAAELRLTSYAGSATGLAGGDAGSKCKTMS